MSDSKKSLRTLTIIQPWSHIIVHGPKRVENRTWEPRGLAVGDYLAIHAGVFTTKRGGVIEQWVGALHLAREHNLLPTVPLLADYDRIVSGERGRLFEARCKTHIERAVPYGAVVGVARLAGVERTAPAGDPWWCGPVGWRLSDVVAIDPVPCKGAQGLWTVEGDTLAAVRANYKIAVARQRETM